MGFDWSDGHGHRVVADDEARTVTEYVDGVAGDPRPYTEEEVAALLARIGQEARLTDLEVRVTRIEAHLWPPEPDPQTPDAPGVKAWDELDPPGVWPIDGLLRDGGKIWRNVSGAPLTSPPSELPGDPGAWGHLFLEVVVGGDPGDPEPETPEGYVGPWSKDASYEVGDVVSHEGFYWRCRLAHGAERMGTWAPGPATPTIWQKLSAV